MGLLDRNFSNPLDDAVLPKFDMTFENIKSKLNSILDIDFSDSNNETLINNVNTLFLIYRDFINESIFIEAKNTRPIGNRLDKYHNIRERMEKQIATEEITDRLGTDNLTKYAYGAYLANQIAHLFDTFKGERLRSNPFYEGSLITFSKEFSDNKRSREIAKSAYAIKSMFTAKIVEEVQKDENMKERVYWGKDDADRYALTVDTNNKDLKGKPITISVHVIDPDLINYFVQHKRRDGWELNFDLNGSRPSKILIDDILTERD